MSIFFTNEESKRGEIVKREGIGEVRIPCEENNFS